MTPVPESAYIREIQSNMPKITDSIKNNIVNDDDFAHEKYFGPEIIPWKALSISNELIEYEKGDTFDICSCINIS